MKKIILLLLFSYSVFGQSAQELRNTLNQGKKLYTEGDYRAAMNTLESFANSPAQNDLQLYGTYFYALSAFAYKDYTKSAEYLQKIIKKYPNWQQIGEVYYILAAAQFEHHEWENAYLSISKAQFSEGQESILKLKKHFFVQMPLNELEKLSQKNLTDETLKEVTLIRKAAQNPDSKLAKEVSEKMDVKTIKIQAKKRYQVALLFPFDLSNTNTSSNQRKNQFVLDMYSGIKLAQKELDSAGFKIDVLAYDTEQSTAHLRGILQHDKFKNIDFIIGPLNFDATSLSMEFAQKNQVLNIQPLSNNHDLLKNPYTYLLQPSFKTQAQKAARFALDSFPDKTAIVYYGASFRDSVLAWEYKDYFEKNGGTVKVFRKFNKGSSGNLAADFGKVSSKSHIFISTDQELLAMNVLSISRANHKFLPIIATEDWLNFPVMSLEQYDQEPIYFLMPDWIDTSSPYLESFKKKYFQQTNIIPSRYAYLGYETLLYFGRKIKLYGAEFPKKIQETTFEKGNLLFGLEYGQNRDNQVVPICRFLEGKLSAVNYLPTEEEDE